jgi:predicted transcriptional regulator
VHEEDPEHYHKLQESLEHQEIGRHAPDSERLPEGYDIYNPAEKPTTAEASKARNYMDHLYGATEVWSWQALMPHVVRKRMERAAKEEAARQKLEKKRGKQPRGHGLDRDDRGRFLPSNEVAEQAVYKPFKEPKAPKTPKSSTPREYEGSSIPGVSTIDGMTVGRPATMRAAPPIGTPVLPSSNTTPAYYHKKMAGAKAGSVFKLSKKMQARS